MGVELGLSDGSALLDWLSESHVSELRGDRWLIRLRDSAIPP